MVVSPPSLPVSTLGYPMARPIGMLQTLERLFYKPWGKWMAGENLAPVLAVLSHGSVGYRRTIMAPVHYKCPDSWSLEVAVFHALTKDSFPVWVAGRKLFLGWNIHRSALLRRPGCVIRVELALLA